MMTNSLPIKRLPLPFLDVAEANQYLTDHPELWNTHQMRTVLTSPHREVSDIWARYNFDPSLTNTGAFKSSWQPELEPVLAPLVKQLTDHLFSGFDPEELVDGGSRLGGVLITRIPAHKQVYPHVDKGWHAGFYQKYCICLKANDDQSFCFINAQLRTISGQVFWFRNDVPHWVLNPSDEDRISMIVCIRPIQ
jgi:hypothetical protein